jgi:hypothetical protein
MHAYDLREMDRDTRREEQKRTTRAVADHLEEIAPRETGGWPAINIHLILASC